MWLSIDLKRLENHLHFLDEESREVARLIDSLVAFCAISLDPEPLIKQIERLNQESERIKQRRHLLENIISELRAVVNHAENTLDDALNNVHLVE